MDSYSGVVECEGTPCGKIIVNLRYQTACWFRSNFSFSSTDFQHTFSVAQVCEQSLRHCIKTLECFRIGTCGLMSNTQSYIKIIKSNSKRSCILIELFFFPFLRFAISTNILTVSRGRCALGDEQCWFCRNSRSFGYSSEFRIVRKTIASIDESIIRFIPNDQLNYCCLVNHSHIWPHLCNGL